jgi:hypothetical protein
MAVVDNPEALPAKEMQVLLNRLQVPQGLVKRRLALRARLEPPV